MKIQQFFELYKTELCSGSETGSYLRLAYCCMARGPSWICNESEEEEEAGCKFISLKLLSLVDQDIKDVPAHIKAEIQQFFELYKTLESSAEERPVSVGCLVRVD